MLQTAANRSAIQAKKIGPFKGRERSTLKFNKHSAPPIPKLHGFGSPSAVIFRITLVVVDSLDRVFRGRPSSHIAIKLLKRIEPRFANTNSATAVVLKCLTVWIQTTILNVTPHTILNRLSPAVFESTFYLPASARFCVAAFEILPVNNGCVPAITSAFPSGHSYDVRALYSQGHKSAEAIADRNFVSYFWFGQVRYKVRGGHQLESPFKFDLGSVERSHVPPIRPHYTSNFIERLIGNNENG